MGWRGTLRTTNRIINQMERDARRRQRELEKQRKEYEKLEALEQARFEVDDFENYIERITTVHHDCSGTVDWAAIVAQKAPVEPTREPSHEETARKRLESFRPNLANKILGNSEKKIAKLKAQLTAAKEKDERDYQALILDYETDKEAYGDEISLAEGVLRGDLVSLREAIEELNAFREISDLGSSIAVEFEDDGLVSATLNVHGEDIVPKTSKSLLSSGRLSQKQMPKGRFYELYQDYVCGGVLRVGREIFAMVPVDELVVTAVDEILNTSTGHVEVQPIVSVYLVRQTMERLNFLTVDPSDAMQNFVHNMDFKKTKGFGPVDLVKRPAS